MSDADLRELEHRLRETVSRKDASASMWVQ